jgi:hypothetical protein
MPFQHAAHRPPVSRTGARQAMQSGGNNTSSTARVLRLKMFGKLAMEDWRFLWCPAQY